MVKYMPFCASMGKASLSAVSTDDGAATALWGPGASTAPPLLLNGLSILGAFGPYVALEATARGPTLRCLDATFVAVVGASPDLRLQGQPIAA